MEPFHAQGADYLLEASLGDDGIIYLRMSGNLSEDNLNVFASWAEKVKEAMRTAAARDKTRVLTLIDVTGAREADEKSVVALHALMEYNRDYATRTAVFGAGYFMKLIIELAIVATRRTNMHIFSTRDEAFSWLTAAPAAV